MNRTRSSRVMIARRQLPVVGLAVFALSCATAGPSLEPATTARADRNLAPADRLAVAPRQQSVQPMLAKLLGYMPLHTTGVDVFRMRNPTFDGRGVLIAILDSGIDVGVPGLQTGPTGGQKVLDLRDFSDEARITLQAVVVQQGAVTIGGRSMRGMDRVARLARPPYYAGVLDERSFGSGTSADLNGNGRVGDTFPLLVARGTQGWFVVADTDEDGDLGDETPVNDFLDAGATFSLGYDEATDIPGPVTIAANIVSGDPPSLALVFDNSGHGTHVAGIAAGHGLYGVDGFDGVAPGASLLGLKISDNTRGGVTVTGSMLRALNYAVSFAQRRGMALIVNISFGIGHEREGSVAIDSLVNEFALKHPDVLVVISAGNDGPGISTVWLPGSARHALSVCGMVPGVFAREQEVGRPAAGDVLSWWSSRGGESAKPDLCAPGVAYSTLPRWRSGDEISLGTSMAAPHVAGIAALLHSALAVNGTRVRAIDLKRALANTTVPIGATVLDRGSGVADVGAAYQWLLAGHRSGVYEVEALGATGGGPATAVGAYRRAGLTDPADTVQWFHVTSVGGQPAAQFALSTNVAWLHAPMSVEMSGAPVTIPVSYDADMLSEPGLYVGVVSARPVTDTIAGPSFELVNTVIVPHQLDGRMRDRGIVMPGDASRYFFNVNSNADGFVITLTASAADVPVSVYLFEPTGRPARGGRVLSVGGDADSVGRLIVSPDDVRSGVYEAAVVGPDAAAAGYTVEIELSPLVVLEVDTQGRALVRNNSNAVVNAMLETRVLGLAQSHTVRGAEAAVRWQIDVPTWAERIGLDVTVPGHTWALVTDFGITVYDRVGWKVVDAPLNYREGSFSFNVIDHAGEKLDIEFAPAFAHLRGPDAWTVEATVTFAPSDTIEMTGSGAAVRIAPRSEQWVPFGRPIFDQAMPQPMLVELTLRDGPTIWTATEHIVDPVRAVVDSVGGVPNE